MTPPLDSSLLLLVVAFIAFTSAALHSLSGFGGALLLAAGLSFVIDVKQVVPLTTVAMMVAHSGRTWAFRHSIPWRAVIIVFSSALPFIVLGAMYFVKISEELANGLIGAYLLLSIPLRHVFLARGIVVGRLGLATAAIPYGLVSGVTFGAGLVLAPFLIGAGILGESLVAFVAALGIGLNVVKVIVFTGSPLLNGSILLIGLAIGLCTIPGTYIGRWLLRATPLRLHAAALETIVLAAGVAFIYRALF